MKQGIFTLQKLSQVWGQNHQSLNTQLPSTGDSYTPAIPTRDEYRDSANINTTIDTDSATWTNIASVNSDTGETPVSRTTASKIPINVWGDLLINGRKALASYLEADSPYFNSLILNDNAMALLDPKSELMEGEFGFRYDGGDDIFLNLGGSPAHIVRFLRSDSHISYENVEDIVVREINWIQSATPSSDLAEGRLWYDTTNKFLMRYDGTSFKKVYYLAESDNNLTETTTEGTGALKYNTLYVYCPFVSSVKTPKSIFYFDGTDLVELGGSGNGVIVANSSTSSSTQAKTATIANVTPASYADLADQKIRVYFSSGNSYRGNAPTINFNSLGAINIRCSGNLGMPIVDNQTAGSFMEGVITYYATDSAYVFAVDAPQVLQASAGNTYYLALKSQAGSADTPNTFIIRDNNISAKGSVLTAKGYSIADSVVTFSANTSGSLINEITEVTIGNEIKRSRGIKRIEVNMRLETSQSAIVLFTVPAGYVAVSDNGTASKNYVGMAWYRSTQSDYTGQTFNLKYYDTSGTLQTVSVSGAGVVSPYNDSATFEITGVMGPGNVQATLLSSTNKGPVAIYGTFLLIPDGNQTA